MALGFLEWSARRGGLLLALGIFAGLFIPPLAALFRDVVTFSVATLMTIVLLRVDLAQVVAYLRRPVLVALLVAWMMLVCPVLLFLVLRGFGFEGPLVAGLVISAMGCAATSSPAFARMVGLDGEISLVVAILTTLIVPFTAPPLALGLMGIDLAISLSALMGRLMLVVGLPLLIAVLLRRLAGPARLQRYAGALDGAVVWLAKIISDPAWVLAGLALAFAANFGLNAATALVFAPTGQKLALTAGLLGGNRNMALFLAVLPAATDQRILLFFALGQFPLFLTPFLLLPIYRRFKLA